MPKQQRQVCPTCGQKLPKMPSRSPLARMRIDRGFSRQQVADAIGVATGTIRRLELGDQPHLKTALALAKVYGISVEKLIELMDTQPSPELPSTDGHDAPKGFTAIIAG